MSFQFLPLEFSRLFFFLLLLLFSQDSLSYFFFYFGDAQVRDEKD